MNEFESTELNEIIDAIKAIVDIDDELLDDSTMEIISNYMHQSFSPSMVKQIVGEMINNFERQNMSKKEAILTMNTLVDFLNNQIYKDKEYTGNKKIIVNTIINSILDIVQEAIDKYHSYSIELPITLDVNAQIPTYAHETDAAADMYATEDIIIPAHFHGVPVGTGVHIQLPEGWVAMLFPRSSIGAKTPLRLSNSAGIIDSGYRGEIRALYDNIGDEPYQIHKGDRIAQLMVMPSYRFKAQVVDTLEDSDRGEGGFGSTGT